MEKTLILTPDDFYLGAHGDFIRGGSRRLFDATLVVLVDHDGQIVDVLKNRYGYSREEVEEIIRGRKDRRLLLFCQ